MTTNYFTHLSDEQLLSEYTFDKRDFDRDNPNNKAPLYVDHSPLQYVIIGKWYYEHSILFKYGKALDWLFKADRLGDKEAGHYIGRIYYDTGSESQCKYAYQWFKKSALTGFPDSEYYLGEMYSEGKGVMMDVGTALVWYTKAALHGHLQAQLKTGLIYAETPNHRESVVKGYYWLSEAAKRNNLDAIRALKKLRKNTNYDIEELIHREHPYAPLLKEKSIPEKSGSSHTIGNETVLKENTVVGTDGNNNDNNNSNNDDIYKQPVQSEKLNVNTDRLATVVHSFIQEHEQSTHQNKNTTDKTTITQDDANKTRHDGVSANTQNDISSGLIKRTQHLKEDDIKGMEGNNNGKVDDHERDWIPLNGTMKSASEERLLESDFNDRKKNALTTSRDDDNTSAIDSGTLDHIMPEPNHTQNTISTTRKLVSSGEDYIPVENQQSRRPTSSSDRRLPVEKLADFRAQHAKREDIMKDLRKKKTMIKKKRKKISKAIEEHNTLSDHGKVLNELFYAIACNSVNNMEFAVPST
ncbi:hypothetical protein K501DRAFT_334221 [Backusella circina FSU 941]|nr:hypothetical protein K501DRAFT_334221 [Backusella circina FSU 941]